MLPQIARLNLRTEFSRIARSRRTETSSFKFFYHLSSSDSPPLVGISLSKKQLRQAHDRNRARRLTATAIQSLYPRLPFGIELVIMPKAEVLTKTSQQLEKEISDVKDLRLAD